MDHHINLLLLKLFISKMFHSKSRPLTLSNSSCICRVKIQYNQKKTHTPIKRPIPSFIKIEIMLVKLLKKHECDWHSFDQSLFAH